MKEPKIRLKGFTREWEKKVIGDMGTTYSGLSGKTREDFGQGDASYVTFLNVLTNAQIDTSILEPVNVAKSEHQNLVKKGDLLFNTSSETPDEVGLCAVMDEDVENVYLNSFCFGFRVTDSNIDPKCVAYLMRSPIGRTLMSILGQGATRYNLSKNNFCKSDILLPSDKDEQESIAEYFQNLDSLIQSTNKKIESLKQVKAASLLSMFPQEGETTPRVRFKGFVGEWDVVTLGSVGTFRSNGVDKLIRPEEKMINLLNYLDVYNSKHITKDNCTSLMQVSASDRQIKECDVKKDDIFFTPSSETAEDIGHVLVANEDLPNTCYSYHLMRFRPIVGVFFEDFPNYGFMTSFVRSQMRVLAKGVQRFVIGKPEFESIKVQIPSYKEQEKIAKYFRSLDCEISALSQQLEKLQQIKSACLDKMFV